MSSKLDEAETEKMAAKESISKRIYEVERSVNGM
jgi:hypothetical protein